MTEAPSIWLCDLTYTQQTVASDVMPAAIGCIASYTASRRPNPPQFRLFKFPEKLATALDNEPAPAVIGFSNYIWNRDLSSQFAAVIKRRLPGVVTVFGGPNYPTNPAEQEEFVRAHPMFDFFIVKEGEAAFADLVERLEACAFDPGGVPHGLPSVHRLMADGGFDGPQETTPRLDLSDIPSPYLQGLMDEFFDGVMLPIIQTNRGCPFRCTFCVEGTKYYSKVAKGKTDRVRDEMNLIGARMAELRRNGRARSDMFIADSNFGMYKEDLDTCRAIAEVQKTYGFPEYINVATGKNQKHRVLEAANIISGSLRISGSVQSLDKDVLENIERNNIDEQEILDLALAASEIGANSYSEIILGLPGDSLQAHLKTIRTIVEADFNTVALFQLMLLPGTDLATRESVDKWKMVNRYRVLPRCYGYFDVLGEAINAAEVEEICVGNDAITFDEYLSARHMHLVVNLFYNDAVYKEVLRLIKLLSLSKYEWIERIWAFRGNDRFDQLIADFLAETKAELWGEREDLEDFVRQRDTVKRYIDGELGANLIFKYKTLGLIRLVDEVAEVATKTLTDYFTDKGVDAAAIELGRELIEFGRLRASHLFDNLDASTSGAFKFDVIRFSDDLQPRDVADYRFAEPADISFDLTDEQKKTARDFLEIYGDSVIGIGRILSKIYVRRLYRIPEYAGEARHLVPPPDGQDLHSGDRGLTGLNEFV